jgi:hypothetical protein
MNNSVHHIYLHLVTPTKIQNGLHQEAAQNQIRNVCKTETISPNFATHTTLKYPIGDKFTYTVQQHIVMVTYFIDELLQMQNVN